MRPRKSLPDALSQLITVQAGVIGRGQLQVGGVTPNVVARMLAGGDLTVLTPGVYAQPGEVGWLGRAWAGLILGGGESVLGGEAAGYLHSLTKAEPAEIAVYTPRQLSPREGWLFVRTARRKSVGEPPRTTVEETVLDLCADLDEDALTALIADAVGGRRTSEKRLRAALAARVRMPQRQLVREILGDVGSGTHSALERRFRRDVEQAHGLPPAIRQAQTHDRHRSDAYYDEYGVVAELDSKLHHRGSAAFRDAARDNDHALAGLFTLRFGWAQVTGTLACETAQLLGRVLASRGWEGPLTSCPRCALRHPV